MNATVQTAINHVVTLFFDGAFLVLFVSPFLLLFTLAGVTLNQVRNTLRAERGHNDN